MGTTARAWICSLVGISVLVGYWAAFCTFLLHRVAYDLRWLPILDPIWVLIPVSVGTVKIVLAVTMCATAVMCSMFLADLRLGRRSGKLISWGTKVSFTVWGTVVLTGVVSTLMGGVGLWKTVMYIESTYDAASKTINLRGVEPRAWSMPVLALCCSVIVIVVGLRYTHGARRPLVWSLCKWYLIVAGVVFIAGFAQRLPAYGSALSLYTGVGTGQVLTLISTLWALGMWMFLLWIVYSFQGNEGQWGR